MTNPSSQYFRIFFEASHAVLSARSLHETLKLLVKRSVQALRVKAGSLRLVNDKTGELELAASHLLSKRYLDKGRLHVDKSISQVMEKKVVILGNAAEDPRVEYQEAKREEGIDTILSVPVTAKGKVIGVLRLYTAKPCAFSDEEIEFVAALAEMGGLAIANAKVYDEHGVKLANLFDKAGLELPYATAGRKIRFKVFKPKDIEPTKSFEAFRTMHRITTAILANLDSKEAMDQVLEGAVREMEAKGGAIFMINQTTGELNLMASLGLSDAYLGKGPLHADRSIQDVLEGEPVMISDVSADNRIEYPDAAVREGIVSILSVPIIARARVIGVLRIYRDDAVDYSEENIFFLSALAEIAGIAFMNARLYEQTAYDLSFWQATLNYLNPDAETEA